MQKNIISNTFPFFEPGLIAQMEEKGVLRKYLPGDELIRPGQYINNFPLVISGLIRVIRNNQEGHELLLYYLKEKEACSMSLACCLSNIKSNIAAITEEDSLILMIDIKYCYKVIS